MAMKVWHGFPCGHRHRGWEYPPTVLFRSGPMARRRTSHSRWGLTLAALVATGLATASEVQGQVAAPPIGPPAVDFGPVEGPTAPAAAVPWPVYGARPANVPADGPPPPGVPVEMGLLDTITESLF